MVKIFHLLIITFILVSCVPDSRSTDNVTLTNQASANSLIADVGNIDVYFSDPGQRIDGDYRNGPEMYLVQAINAARISVDMAVYSINLWSIRDALLDAFHRGLQVRIVMESDNITDDVPLELQAGGISILGDRRESLMHNKFVILDRQDVWTGSMNFTVGSSYYDNNNFVHLRSSEIADNYLTEFNEMYVQDMFGRDVITSTPHPQVLIGGSQIEVYFSPDDGVAGHIVDLINEAQESIYFMAYSFTSDDIGLAIISRSENGILVVGVMDDSQVRSNTGTEFDRFIQAGLKVYKDGNSGLMHNKVIIIDRKIVITGSYNFSRNAEINNDENVIVIHNPEIAKKYIQEFEKILSEVSQ
jgi:phosphatidylserine/phosphatidylglycerophosphate/cardiolipin synthase-like enzyme